MEFDKVIAPLSRQKFFAEHHGRKFAQMKGAPGRFTGLLGWDELNAILEQHRLAPPRLILVQDGHTLAPDRFLSAGMSGTPRLDSGKLASCLAGGATLILNMVEELAPRVRDLSDSLRDAFRVANYVNLYAGWHSQNGFDLHWDNQETVVVQLSGRKRWRVYGPTRLHPLEDDIEEPPKPTGAPIWEGMLEDGDAIYIPRGWWHMAFPVNEPSLHLTFSIVQPHGLDLLRWVAGKLREHVELRQDLPAIEDGAAQAARLAKLRTLVNEALGDGAIASFRRQWEAETFPRAHVQLPQSPYQQFAPVSDAGKVRLATQHRLHYTIVGAYVHFTANGVLYRLPVGQAPAFELLSDTRATPVAELAATLTSDRDVADLRTNLNVLARAGVLLIES